MSKIYKLKNFWIFMEQDNKLESILLAKAVKRFQRTPIKKMEVREEVRENLERATYILGVGKFKIIFHYFADSIKGEEKYNLSIRNSNEREVEYYDESKDSSLQLLKEIYESTKKRIVESQEEEEKEEEKKFEKGLNRLKRIL